MPDAFHAQRSARNEFKTLVRGAKQRHTYQHVASPHSFVRKNILTFRPNKHTVVPIGDTPALLLRWLAHLQEGHHDRYHQALLSARFLGRPRPPSPPPWPPRRHHCARPHPAEDRPPHTFGEALRRLRRDTGRRPRTLRDQHPAAV